MPLLYDGISHPVTLGPGRADLRYSSVPFAYGSDGNAFARSITLAGERNVSFARLFATQPWIAAAVTRMQTWAVRVPLKAYRRTGDDSRERLAPKDHPLAAAIVSPWQRGSQAQLVQSLLGPVLVHGNSLTDVDQGAGDQIQFVPKDWRRTIPLFVLNELMGWQYNEGEGEPTPIGLDTAVHIAWWSPLSQLGISPLYQLGITLQIEDAAQRYERGLFNNGARPPSVITMSDAYLGYDPAEKAEITKNLRADITALHAGPDNAGRTPLLPPGLDWKIAGHSAVEAELIAQRQVAREEIAAVYTIPPPMLGILDHATYSNVQVMREMSYTDALGPRLVVIEQAINAQVVAGLLREDDIFVEFDFAGVLRGDRLKEIQALREGISIGLLTPNEGRSILNYPQTDDALANKQWMPRNNLRPIDEPPYLTRGGTIVPSDDVAPQPPPPADAPAGDITEPVSGTS